MSHFYYDLEHTQNIINEYLLPQNTWKYIMQIFCYCNSVVANIFQVKLYGVNAYLIDGLDTSNSNWKTFDNCARCEDEQNYHGNIYYHTVKTIYPESELLDRCGGKIAKSWNRFGN